MKKSINSKVLKNITLLSKIYKKEHLERKANLLSSDDFWKADLAFIRTMFNRGRRDELSFYFSSVAVCLLGDYFGNNKKEIKEKLKNLDLEDLAAHLNKKAVRFDYAAYASHYEEVFKVKPREKKYELKLTNHKDIDLVVSALGFIAQNCKKHNYNIHSYAKEKIEKGELKELFARLDSIKEVGHKLSSFFIRDMVFMHDLERHVSDQDMYYLFPVDTWVRQIAKVIGFDENAKDKALVRQIVQYCKQENINPMDFNAGAWYLGSRPLRLLLEHGLINYVEKMKL